MYLNFKKKLGNITTKFGGKTKNEKQHPGVDIANSEGTPIPAITKGVITAVGKAKNGFGNVVGVKAPNGDIQQFSHLKKSLVKPGQKIKKGQLIAQMGKSGNSYSPSGGDPSHLDIRIVDRYKKFKDPTPFLKGL